MTKVQPRADIRLRSDLVLLSLDGDFVVFSEKAQCLVGLNASAAFVLRELHAGTPHSELAHAIVSEGLAAPEEAERWVTTAIEALGSYGMLADGGTLTAAPMGTLAEDPRLEAWLMASMPRYAPFEPVKEKRYRLLGCCVAIRFAHLAQVRLVDAAIGHLATEDPSSPSTVIDIRAATLRNGHLRSDVYRDEKPVGFAPRLSMLGPVVKSAVWQSAVNSHDFLFYIHAGVVGAGESCVLLPAAAGSGKSSLTVALIHRGFRYFSDEVALIERTTFRVPPMPLAMCVKSTGWDLMSRYYPEISALPVHRREDDKVVRYIPPPAGAALQPAAPVSHIIFPRFVSDVPTELRPIARSEALGRLMGECLALRQRLDQANVSELLRWISAIEVYALDFSSLEEGAELIAQIVQESAKT